MRGRREENYSLCFSASASRVIKVNVFVLPVFMSIFLCLIINSGKGKDSVCWTLNIHVLREIRKQWMNNVVKLLTKCSERKYKLTSL